MLDACLIPSVCQSVFLPFYHFGLFALYDFAINYLSPWYRKSNFTVYVCLSLNVSHVHPR